MQAFKKIAVIGGTGKSGQYLVKELVRQGYQLKLLVRDPQKLSWKDPLVKVIAGDVRQGDVIHSLVQDCQAVISTLGLGIPASEPTIFSQSTAHVIKAMTAGDVQRYIVTYLLTPESLSNTF